MAKRALTFIVCGAVVLAAAPAPAQPQPAPREPIVLPDVGTIRPARPPVAVIGKDLVFDVDGERVTVGMTRNPRGSCVQDGVLRLLSLGKGANGGIANGYWPTKFESDDTVYGCLDLREGFLLVSVRPAARRMGVTGALAEIRHAAYVDHGAPRGPGEALPHSGRRVAYGGRGAWKVVDGEAFKRPGADVFVSIAGLGDESAFHSVAVLEGACAPGAITLAPELAKALFPSQLGTVWVDPARDDRLHWSAWACLSHEGGTATIAIIGPFAGDDPPEPNEPRMLRALVDAIAASYGVELRGGRAPPARPGRHRSRTRTDGFAAGYVGVLSFAPPDDGERRIGVLVGADLRIFKGEKGARPGVAIDLELGRGGGEFLGELRLGVGAGLGPLELVVGGGLGNPGPGAPTVDGHVQLGATFRLGRARLWTGGLRAFGVGGPDHDQLDLKLVIPNRADDTGIYVGARVLQLRDTAPEVDGGPAIEHGSAIMVILGGAAASHD